VQDHGPDAVSAPGVTASPEAPWAEAAAVTLVLAVAASVKIALANALLGLALILWLRALLLGQAKWLPARLYLPLLAYVVASLGAVVFSQDPRHSLSEVGELLTLALVPMAVSLLDQRHFGRLVAALAAVAALSSAIGLWQYLHGASSLANRLRGLNNHYMTFSGWALVAALVLLGDILFNPDRRRLLWTLPCFTLCVLALALSYTRGAWVGLGAGLVLAVAVWRPRVVLVLPVLALGITMLLPRAVLERAVSIVDLRHPSNYDRLCMVVSGLEMVEDHPLLGVGLGMVERRYPVYRQDDAPRWRVPHLHNNLLQIGAERGLIGVGCYGAVLVVFALHSAAALRARGRAAFAAVASCVLAVAGITVAGLFEYNWGDAEVWMVTLTLLATPFALHGEGA
jgi:putative inorganic carbon (hco3(-)) transporter